MIKNETKKQRKDRKAKEAITEEIRVARVKKKGEQIIVVGKDENLAKLAAQANVDKAVAEVVDKLPIKNVIPWCKAPGCDKRAATTRGLCRKHEELFLYIYWLFTTERKPSGLVTPGGQQGKTMTNFDLLIKGKL